jgi:hypothetical protein
MIALTAAAMPRPADTYALILTDAININGILCLFEEK